MIKNALLQLWWLWWIQGPLALINAFGKVLNYLTGGVITDLLFGSHQSFTFSSIPMQFWWFVIVAVSIWIVVFAVQLLVLQFREETEIKVKFILAFTNGAKGFAFMFVIPIAFFLMNFIIQGFANLITNNFGSGNNIAQYLWHIGDPNWDGTANGVPSDFGAPDNLNSYNFIVQTFGTWFMGIGLFLVGLLLMQKVIELFLLFVVSPIVMMAMTLDEGKAANTWKDMVVSKFLASTATLIGYFIFISALQEIIHNGTPSLQSGDFTRQLFLLFFMCAGALAMLGFADISAALVGEAAGIREGFSSFKSTFAGMGMMMGAAKITGRALGFAKNKRALTKDGSILDGSNQNTSNMMSQPNEAIFSSSNFGNFATGMAARSGIIGLAGWSLQKTARGVGYAAGGIKKSWNAADRKGGWAKTRGVARVIGKASVAPITGIGKAFGSGLKTEYTTAKNNISYAHNSKINKHEEYLRNKKEKYSEKIQKMESKISDKVSTKKNQKQTNKINKQKPKLEKVKKKYSQHYGDKK